MWSNRRQEAEEGISIESLALMASRNPVSSKGFKVLPRTPAKTRHG